MTADQWEGLVHAKNNDPTLDPATAPGAHSAPVGEVLDPQVLASLGAFKTPESEPRSRTPARWRAAAIRRPSTLSRIFRASLAPCT